VRNLKSEVGVLYLNDFNEKVLTKIIRDADLEFIPLFECPISVYLWKNHPLADRNKIKFEELSPYPCLSFEQGENNSFHFAEEVLATRDYDRIIKADDRATMLNLMVGLNAYTLCSGIICENLNGEYYRAVPLDTDDVMTIGYIKKKRMPLSALAEEYITELLSFRPTD
jgi:DNA-binding transcriptional LysR family regulator